MKEDDKNVAVIHCKAGKGRTGLMICCWLMYCGMWKNTEDSLRFYAALRTYNQKGVTIPSQIRYVHYFGKSIRENIKYVPRTVLLKKIVLKPLPKEINLSEIQFNISVGKTSVFTSKDSVNVIIHKTEKKKKEKSPKESKKDKKDKKLSKENSEAKLEHSPSMQSVNGGASLSSSTNNAGMNTISSQTLSQLGGSQFSLSDLAGDASIIEEYIAFEIGSLPLLGDIRIEFTDKNGDRMFMFWINTSFVQQHESIPKIGLDKAHKDKNHKSYPEDFHVELFFEQLEPSHTTVVASAEEHFQQYPHSSNNVATSSSHNEILDNTNNSSPQSNINNNNSNNISLNSSNNNISLSSSQVKPIVETDTEKKIDEPTVVENQEQVPPTTKVEAEKVENSNASANDSETSSDTSSNNSN
ncbi:hypothetical protein DICPUDRAFT_93257 [Dictyostelium purpureum]|uniref:Phosphatidylinositol 3,4,5-trisphosphate 3-phosphatase and dual-specificity protein phosphatase PTEN n=1 Tax=Dictyostelium purpureum TaxID=5786 RepID=F1A4R2_DICPU|nr:uncharacterized protein DICPUDRAFT_93257 [Dictyostelium purpureum]EGC28823.1 hypothetical protein DICPUDRAFT_93257 [Dictyostelium purpureum]|eukprot:XP_003294656.1 hypothetical protein DICPUDRAFT_93257 [Dictyostelium purpureum]